MRGIIDRFEGEWVVVEIDGETKDFEKSLFPEEAVIGDIVDINDENIKVLKNETEKRRKEIEKLMDDVWDD
ncbi:DUF3006 domain-containing protein [Lederbergia citri]|uniref:DUF3006 domain-containing protein n=1 Tax=Lederbergia citri TaxID=2833580 RepID=A0A942YHP4_9BACI|nr:DUF3006 domain-containing protein [Lederbergia citri]MBS4197493.1 DUF3006 domain-containing protein [Lederbergia citri]